MGLAANVALKADVHVASVDGPAGLQITEPPIPIGIHDVHVLTSPIGLGRRPNSFLIRVPVLNAEDRIRGHYHIEVGELRRVL